MTMKRMYPVGVLFFLAACVSTLCAAEPSSVNADEPEAKAREIRSVALPSDPVAPIEPYRARRKSIIERQTPAPVLPLTPYTESETKAREIPPTRVPAAPVESVGQVKEQKIPAAEKQVAIPPLAPINTEPAAKSREAVTIPVPIAPVPSSEPLRGRRNKVVEKQPVIPPVMPKKVPVVLPKKAVKTRAVDNDGLTRSLKVSAAKTERCLRLARSAYNAGDFGETEERLNECLAADPGNLTAQELKSKIAILRERMLAVQEDVADEYYHNAEYFYEKGNLPEALLWIERSVKLNRKSPLPRMLYQTLQQEEANMLLKVNKSDKKALEEGIKYFLDEDFDNAAMIFRELQRHYPEINEFLSTAMIHSSDAKNGKRSREYINEALENMKLGRYKNAQEKLYLALQMDTTNLYARLVLEQVNLELGSSSSSMTHTAAVSVPVPATTVPR